MVTLKDRSAAFEAMQKAESAYFDLVKNSENWKFPIDAVVEIPSGSGGPERFAAAIKAAIEFFTGGGVTTEVRSGYLYVKAPGYYKNIGA